MTLLISSSRPITGSNLPEELAEHLSRILTFGNQSDEIDAILLQGLVRVFSTFAGNLLGASDLRGN